jgi:hypothetical protein
LRADESTALVHEEHDPIPMPPGTYRVVRQREYARRVAVDGVAWREIDEATWREIED